jgi:8-oxo-dGTP pyrophosphatase MutT (NUDIX family)
VPRPRPALKALLERDGEYLFLKQSTGTGHVWTLPGGKVEFGEPPVRALRREVAEETGLAVDVGAPVGVYDFRFGDTHVVVTVLACECREESPVVDVDSNPADEEVLAYEWARADVAATRETNEGLAALLQSL